MVKWSGTLTFCMILLAFVWGCLPGNKSKLKVRAHNRAIVIGGLDNYLYPLGSSNEPLVQGAQYKFSPTYSGGGDEALTYNCTYETIALAPEDPLNKPAGTKCTEFCRPLA